MKTQQLPQKKTNNNGEKPDMDSLPPEWIPCKSEQFIIHSVTSFHLYQSGTPGLPSTNIICKRKLSSIVFIKLCCSNPRLIILTRICSNHHIVALSHSNHHHQVTFDAPPNIALAINIVLQFMAQINTTSKEYNSRKRKQGKELLNHCTETALTSVAKNATLGATGANCRLRGKWLQNLDTKSKQRF